MKIKIFLLLIIISASCNNTRQKRIDYSLNEQMINDSINRIMENNRDILNEIEKAMAYFPEITRENRSICLELKIRSDEIIDFLQNSKIAMIIIADGEDSPAINGREINISKVSHLNSVSIPNDFMLGDNEDGKAYVLKAILNDYKSFLNDIGIDDPFITNRIKNKIDLSDHKSVKSKEVDIKVNWANYTFKDRSLGEVLNSLSRLQLDVKNLETDVQSFLERKIRSEIAKDSINLLLYNNG